ncbi:hypothetical protein ACS0TY_032824 [Phlomoides rotata]
MIWSRCLKVKVLWDISNPLCRGTYVSVGGRKTFVVFRYEQLSDFCYLCGKLDHVDRDFPITFNSYDQVVVGVREYETWLRGDGQKMPPIEEIERTLTMGSLDRNRERGCRQEPRNKGKAVIQGSNMALLKGGPGINTEGMAENYLNIEGLNAQQGGDSDSENEDNRENHNVGSKNRNVYEYDSNDDVAGSLECLDIEGEHMNRATRVMGEDEERNIFAFKSVVMGEINLGKENEISISTSASNTTKKEGTGKRGRGRKIEIKKRDQKAASGTETSQGMKRARCKSRRFDGGDLRGRSGGLLLMWNEVVSIYLRSFSRGHIDCSISYLNSQWRFSGFYGNHVQHLRHFSWDLLRKLYSLKQSNNEPWLVGGDFNEIRFDSEKK